MFFEFDDFDVRDRFYGIEEKTERLRLILETLRAEEQERFHDFCARAYIYHDSALDGLVASNEEISSVFSYDGTSGYIRSRVMQEIRNHREVLSDVCQAKTRLKNQNMVYKSDIVEPQEIIEMHTLLYANIARKEPGKYRTVMPLHTAYFHSFVEPHRISEGIKSLCEETKNMEFRTQHPINQAVLVHHQLMQILPFTEGSGKVARLLMNGFLLQGGYSFTVIHSTDRQLYYETLKEGPEAFRELLLESMDAGLEAQIKLLKEQELEYSQKRMASRTIGLF